MDNLLDFSSKDLSEIPDEVLLCNQVEQLILDFNNISVLPVSLFQNLTKLSYFSINGNMLETIPKEICLLENLLEFHAKENCLTCLPEDFYKLQKLSKVHITGNELQKLPEHFGSIFFLSELIAAENKITRLPFNFGNLSFLCHLDLSYNSLIELPHSFGNLKNLKEVDLSNNCLKALPETFKNLPSLEIVDLTNNEIKCLPDEFCSSKRLRKFLMNKNSLTGLPKWFSESQSIQELRLSSNDLLEMPFPAEFGTNNNQLQVLDVSGNNINLLPENFGRLEKLKYLDLGSSFDELERNRLIANGNKLKSLPTSFTNLKSLVKLELDENELNELPNDFGLLVNLNYLDLSHNYLKQLPQSFCELKNLKICSLSMNYLEELPKCFGTLSSLEDLRLDNNMLTELPDSFKYLANLTTLDLYNNKLKEIPTYLSLMKSLKHLDLRENDFGLPLENIPNISSEPTYLSRKKELQNSWRGRERPDINPSSWVEEKTDIPEKNKMNDDIIYSALTATSSVWRKHGQSDERKSSNIFSAAGTNEDTRVDYSIKDSNDFASEVTTSECWDEDLYEETDANQSSNSCNELNSSLAKVNISSYEDINDEVSSSCSEDRYEEELSDWDNNFDDNFRKVYVHQPAAGIHTLIPSDMHANRIRIQEIWSPCEEGQFDDADL